MPAISRSVATKIKNRLRAAVDSKKRKSFIQKVILNPDGAAGQTAWKTEDLRFDYGHRGYLHLQVNNETRSKVLRRYIQSLRKGTHTPIARVYVSGLKGTDKDVNKVLRDVERQMVSGETAG